MANKKDKLKKQVNIKSLNKKETASKVSNKKEKPIKTKTNDIKKTLVEPKIIQKQKNVEKKSINTKKNIKRSLDKEIDDKKKNIKNVEVKSKQIDSKRKTEKKDRKQIVDVSKNKVQEKVLKPQKSEEKTTKIEKTTVKKSRKKISLRFISRIISKVSGFIKSKWKILILVLFVSSISILLCFVLKDAPKKMFLTFKPYNIGDKVTLKDNSSWYVIKESPSSENTLYLLSENIVDINKDKEIDSKDKVVFDSSNSCEYDTKSEKNIGYFLENTVKSMYGKEVDIKKIRLITSEEYINIRDYMKFGYSWQDGNWLSNEKTDSWWLETSKYGKVYVVTKRGSYKLAEAKSKNYVRPVIKIDKDNVK